MEQALKLEENGIFYPESDGKPMADNTKQYRWIVKIKEGLESLLRDNPDVFIAADLLWYPAENDNKTRAAPDVMAAFGRPRGDRGSYRQWEEDDIPPQVVFEILSPGNRPGEMDKKFGFYRRYGVEEYYVYDPDNVVFEGWIRLGNRLRPVHKTQGWVSPRLKIRFEIIDNELVIFDPDGEPFVEPIELREQLRSEKKRAQKAEAERKKAEEKAEAERKKAEAERERNRKLAEKLRSLGIDPDAI